jgi:hypothetical protein
MAGNYDDEQRVMDAIARQRSIGTRMLAVGWVLLIFDCIPVVWLWVGWRSGSMFWTWWVAVEGILGLFLIMTGRSRRSEAVRKADEYRRGGPGQRAA